MKYDIMLVDIDDTLLDFSAAERFAFDAVHKKNGLIYCEEDYLFYHEANKTAWKALEKENLSLEELLSTRFETYVKARKPSVSPKELSAGYEDFLGQEFSLLNDDVLPTLEFISARARIYAITNGITKIQKNRIANSGVGKYLGGAFISQEIGKKKPSADFYDYIKSQIPDLNVETTLVVGDSMTADIPAARFGYHTCLVGDLNADISNYEIQPEFRFSSFSEVKELFK